MSKSETVTIADVARTAGVSAGTVSNFLNRPERVASSTRERIESAIAVHGWVPNVAVRTLRRGKSDVVGLVLSDLSNPFFTDVALAVEEAALQAGYAVMLCNSNNDPVREQHHLARLAEHRVAGVLITPVGGVSERHYKPLLRLYGGHLVLLAQPRHRVLADIPWIAVDDVQGGRLVGAHLLKLGHRRICVVHGGLSVRHKNVERLEGLRSAVSEEGLATESDISELTTAGVHIRHGMQAVDAFLRLDPRPSAVFLATDLLALGFIHGLHAAGLKVPDDVSVVGYDDLEMAKISSPSLTTVAQPRYELGQAAMSVLLEAITSPTGQPREVIFTPSLAERESTAPLLLS